MHRLSLAFASEASLGSLASEASVGSMTGQSVLVGLRILPTMTWSEPRSRCHEQSQRLREPQR